LGEFEEKYPEQATALMGRSPGYSDPAHRVPQGRLSRYILGNSSAVPLRTQNIQLLMLFQYLFDLFLGNRQMILILL
jgi:hypothetical protein